MHVFKRTSTLMVFGIVRRRLEPFEIRQDIRYGVYLRLLLQVSSVRRLGQTTHDLAIQKNGRERRQLVDLSCQAVYSDSLARGLFEYDTDPLGKPCAIVRKLHSQSGNVANLRLISCRNERADELERFGRYGRELVRG